MLNGRHERRQRAPGKRRYHVDPDEDVRPGSIQSVNDSGPNAHGGIERAPRHGSSRKDADSHSKADRQPKAGIPVGLITIGVLPVPKAGRSVLICA